MNFSKIHKIHRSVCIPERCKNLLINQHKLMNTQEANLKSFLNKVKQLRGFGDMDSYRIVSELKNLKADLSEEQLHSVIQNFSTPESYDEGKNWIIDNLENS